MADIVYNNFKEVLMEAGFNLLEGQDDAQVAFFDNTFVENQDTHEDMADLTGELSGTGYVAGGQDLLSQTVTQDDTDNEGVFDAADTVFTGIDAGIIDTIVFQTWTGTAATSELIAAVDTATNLPLTTNGGDVTVAYNAEGILNIT